jgi:WD40 repeat protein
MASGGADGLVRLWSTEGEPRGVLHGHTGWVWALASLTDGLLVSASEDGTVRLWNTGTATEASEPAQAGAPVRALAALPSGELISGQATGELTTWQLTQAPHPALAPRTTRRMHAGAVCSIVPLDEGCVASGGEDDSIHLTRLADFTVLASHRHAGFVRSLAVLPDGQLASASYDTTVRLWPAATGFH